MENSRRRVNYIVSDFADVAAFVGFRNRTPGDKTVYVKVTDANDSSKSFIIKWQIHVKNTVRAVWTVLDSAGQPYQQGDSLYFYANDKTNYQSQFYAQYAAGRNHNLSAGFCVIILASQSETTICQYQSDFKYIVRYLSCGNDRKKLDEYFQTTEFQLDHPEVFLDWLSAVTNDRRYRKAMLDATYQKELLREYEIGEKE